LAVSHVKGSRMHFLNIVKKYNVNTSGHKIGIGIASLTLIWLCVASRARCKQISRIENYVFLIV